MIDSLEKAAQPHQEDVEANHMLAAYATRNGHSGLMLGFPDLSGKSEPEHVTSVSDGASPPSNLITHTKHLPHLTDPVKLVDELGLSELPEGPLHLTYGGSETVKSRHKSSAGVYEATTRLERMTSPTADHGTMATVETRVTRPGYEHTFKDPIRAAKAARLVTQLAAKRLEK